MSKSTSKSASNMSNSDLITALAGDKHAADVAKAKAKLAVSMALNEIPEVQEARQRDLILKAKNKLAAQLSLARDKSVRADQLELVKLKIALAEEAKPPKPKPETVTKAEATAKVAAPTKEVTVSAAPLPQ